ncbi:septum formation initiator family protein [candidate division KSB1 bacterium]
MRQNYYKNRKVILKRKFKKYLFVFLALLFAYVLYGNSNNNIIRLFERKNEENRLKAEIVKFEMENERLKKEIMLLEEEDLDYIEKVAREKFGMIKEGEKVYKIIRTKED